MKKNFLILVSVLFFVSCNEKQAVRKMQRMEEGVANPTTIEEYKDAIEKYQKRVYDIESANSQIGIWYKILGSRYLDQKMYGEALKCYEAALQYYPANQNLFYYVGLCAGYMSHASLDFNAGGSIEKKMNYLKLSESAYLQAIALESRYVRALYGLGVLYVFELDESEKAIPYLEKLLQIDTGHTDAKFVLANAYYRTGQTQKSADLYDNIAKTTKDKTKKKAAEENKKQILDADYVQ